MDANLDPPNETHILIRTYIHTGRLRDLKVVCWITDHYNLSSNLGLGVCSLQYLWRYSADLAYHVHKSVR